MTTRSNPIIAWALAGTVLFAPSAYAVSSTILQFGGSGVPITGSGGPGVLETSLADSGSVVNADHIQAFTGSTLASAQTGALEIDLSTTTTVDSGAPRRLGGFGLADPSFLDEFTILAGSSGLSNGEAVEVLLQVQLQGSIELNGSPSDSSFLSYDVVQTGPGNLLSRVWSGLVPAEMIAIEEFHEILISSTVGAVVSLDVRMSADLNGSGHAGGTSETNFIRLASIARVTHAPGYEDLALISAAGAPTVSLLEPPPAGIPALPRFGLGLMAVLLLGVFWLASWRRDGSTSKVQRE